MKLYFNPMICIVLIGVGLLGTALAEESAAESPSEEAKPAMPEGLVPLVDFTGDIWSRPRLTGDWWGTRTDLAAKGIQFDVQWTQTWQSVVEGGRDRGTRYGGSADYNLVFDLHRMGVMQGGVLKLRAESRYGQSVNGMAGPVLPVNTDAFFPLTNTLDVDIPFTLTNLMYAQFFSEQFGVVLGKFDTMDGDPNEFASGRGTSQFMNANFIFTPALALTTPYSTFGTGVIVMPVKGVTLSSLVFNTSDSSTRTGFEDFGDGWSSVSEAQFQYRLGRLPGGQNIGFSYSTDNDFTQLGSGRFVFRRGEGLTFATDTDTDTWAAYWSLWQYLYVEDPGDAPINLLNGEPDHQGVGLFSRIGFADQDVNPVEWAASGGVGGKGVIPTRDHDTFGVGFFCISLQQTRFSDLLGVDDHSQGFEAFYNIAITPAAHLTLDIQILDSPLPNVEQATVLGLRLNLIF